MKRAAKQQPSKLDSHLGYWLRFVSNHVSLRFQQLLEAEGLSVTEWVALRTLFDKPETTHAELILSLGMTKGAASKVVSRLEAKGLARRSLAGGLREQVLALTPGGKTLVPRLCALADQNDAHFFGHLKRGEREALRDALQKLVSHHRFKQVPVA
ncbi:MarR family winged helix-turn-helix transcriptional regulator [Bordetella genomosp. 13]|uniref:MarR family transcriptional regulator n=1 Tax=Bordetella genomosp. 13 TaxID=463040 RepID=A0A1W6ZBQ2_9BORD|nr:MarR family winged helix-turn-helix transcriptional regulator [Bordetella genomosp. 13]ARP94803.1 MarR family transcriptional regulator [Bordetella genomosp. 13]